MITDKKVSLIEIAKVFFTVGVMGFGGGMAIISLIQEFCVVRKKWMSIEEFSCAIAFAQCWGSRTVNLSIFTGYQLRGINGAIVAVVAFLTPCVTLVIILSALYMNFHKIPSLEAILKGVRPVVIALILATAFKMAKNRVINFEFWFLILVALLCVVFLHLRAFFLVFSAVLYGYIKFLISRGKLNENS